MEPNVLVADEKYRGKYVAMQSFNNRNVVAAGIEPSEVLNAAHKKGFISPVIVFVPEKNITCVY